jgi:hypothetical protein
MRFNIALLFSCFFTRILSNTTPSSKIARSTTKRIQKTINVSFKPTVPTSSKGVLIVAFNKPLLERGLTVRPTFMPDFMDQWRLLSNGK